MFIIIVLKYSTASFEVSDMAIYLNENIKNLRKKSGITQETLADYLGVTFQSVSRWERGDGYPDIAFLPSIASFFNISVDELLGVNNVQNEQKISTYIAHYDSMQLKDLPSVFDEYRKAVKEFPGDFRIMVRYMQLLFEVKIRTLSITEILSGDYKKAGAEIARIYDKIQKYCTEDSIRIWSKTIMVSFLLWKYDCISNEDGQYSVYDEFLQQANEIINTLPSMCNSREIMALDRTDYYATHKNTLEELMFYLHEELFGFCMNYSAEKRIILYESLLNLLNLIYKDDSFGKNCYNRLYDIGFLGHLNHQVGNDEKALKYLKEAALYAKKLDKTADVTGKAKRYYNYGTLYRETTASQFIKIVISEHYPLSEDFKKKDEFKEIIELLRQ